jgi:hypothetical protein
MKPSLTEPEAGLEQPSSTAATPVAKKQNLPGVTGRAEAGQSGRRRGPWPASRAGLGVCWEPRPATELGRPDREAALGSMAGSVGGGGQGQRAVLGSGRGQGRRAAPGSGGDGYDASVVGRMGRRRGVGQRRWTRAKKESERKKRGGEPLEMRRILHVGPTYGTVHFTVAGGARDIRLFFVPASQLVFLVEKLRR